MNFDSIIRFGFCPLKQKETVKYYLLLLLIPIILFALLVGILFLFVGSSLITLLRLGLAGLANPAAWSAIVSSLLLFIGIFIVFVFLFLLVQSYLSALVTLYALRSRSISVPSFNFNRFIGFLILNIFLFFSILVYAPGKRTRLFQWAFIGLTLLSLFVFPLLVILPLLFWIPVIVYASLRLAVSNSYYLSNDVQPWIALKESWTLTQDQVIDLVVALILLMIIIVILSLIATSILGLVLKPVAAALMTSLNLGAFAPMISSVLADNLASFLINPLITIIGLFVNVAIYAELLSNRGLSKAVN